MRAAVLAIAMAVLAACNGQRGPLGPQYEYEEDLTLRLDQLIYFAHWITPEIEPRRYDTRFFLARGFLKRRSDAALAFIESLLPMAVGSVDRLEEIPDRLAFLFQYDAVQALERPGVAEVLHEPGARDVIAALPDAIEIGGGPLLDRESFRAMANRVKEKTGQKGKALFHPIRVALTGDGAGPELDLAVPAMDRGAALPPDAGVVKILSARERAKQFAGAVATR